MIFLFVEITSIRQRLQRIVLLISAGALIITSVLGVAVMFVIRGQSEEALTNETKTNLSNIVSDKAALTEEQLAGYEEYAKVFADYLSAVYAHPDHYERLSTPTIPPDDPKEHVCETLRRVEGLDLESKLPIIERTYNIADILNPVINDPDKNISAFYWGNEDGFLTGFDPFENNLPLATMEDNEYIDEHITLHSGDVLFVYTDGVTDAKNPAKEKFGLERMLESTNAHYGGSMEELLEGIRSDLDTFMQGADPFDDITMMSVLYKNK